MEAEKNFKSGTKTKIEMSESLRVNFTEHINSKISKCDNRNYQKIVC